jgi:hypothetical protein
MRPEAGWSCPLAGARRLSRLAWQRGDLAEVRGDLVDAIAGPVPARARAALLPRPRAVKRPVLNPGGVQPA